MTKKRPVNLNLLTIKFPVTAISSIMHRASGFVLFLLIPVFLWGLTLSFTTEGFANLQQFQACWMARFVEWVLLSALIYHVIAGLRHLAMDMGFFEKLHSGRVSAWLVIILSMLLIVALGGYLL